MKAAVRSIYGLPEVLEIKEVRTPVPKRDELLIRVHYTTVNRTDCAILTGKPFAMRLFTGFFNPRKKITGTDFAGVVVSTGSRVTRFKSGQRVWGFEGFGLQSHAQYLCMAEKGPVIPIPENISYDLAVACAEGGFYALDAVDMVQPQPGQKALVIGATGAIGSAMVQFLTFYGVQVTAVCKGEDSSLVCALGATKIIDYSREDFLDDDEQYDLVFDTVGKNSFGLCQTLLRENGIYTSSEPNFTEVFMSLFRRGKKVKFRPPSHLIQRLSFINHILANGRFKPLIDRTFPLENIADAFAYVLKGEKKGNVILGIQD